MNFSDNYTDILITTFVNIQKYKFKQHIHYKYIYIYIYTVNQ